MPSIAAVWGILDTIPDPEIPVVSLVDMGIVRAVRVEGERVEVDFTPTFSGCPALEVMRRDIVARLRDAGWAAVEVRTVLSPPWTSDWITPAARERLRAFGLAPPVIHGGDVNVMLFDRPACPCCGSPRVTLRNGFGPTLCRAMYQCDNCGEPFEFFKPL